MLLLKAILGTVVGAIAGIFLFVGLTYPLFLAAAGGRDMNGGIAMGMVTGIGPLGMLVGAIAGLVFVLVRSAAAGKEKQDEKPSGKRGLMVAGAIGLFAVGYIVLLFILQGPARISMQTEPDLHFEFRTAASSLVNDDAFTPHAMLFGHSDKRSVPIATSLRIDGETAYLKGKIHVVKGKGYENMRLVAQFAPDLIVEATVPLYPGAEVLPGLREWDAVDYIRMPLSGDSELGYSQDVHMYRYQVLAHEEN